MPIHTSNRGCAGSAGAGVWDKEVEIAVIVEVAPHRRIVVSSVVYLRPLRDQVEIPGSIIVVEKIILAIRGRKKEIQKTVIVIISPGRTGMICPAGYRINSSEGSISIVLEHRSVIIARFGNEQVHVPVVIQVAPDRPVGVAAFLH